MSNRKTRLIGTAEIANRIGISPGMALRRLRKTGTEPDFIAVVGRREIGLWRESRMQEIHSLINQPLAKNP